MAEEETIFDASLKKKKKKKTGFNLDSLDANPTDPQENGSAITAEQDEANDDGELLAKKKKKKISFNLDSLKESMPDGEENSKGSINIEDMGMDFTKMKKKPKMKSKTVVMEDLEDKSIDKIDDTGNDSELLGKKKKKKSKSFTEDEMDAADDDAEDGSRPSNRDDMDMDFSKMKKKPKMKLIKSGGIDDLLSSDKSKDGIEGKENDDSSSWIESDRDYTYEELYHRSFSILKEKNPDMATGEKKKFIMKPPRVMRIGSKKTAFANFSEMCKLLHRIPKHLLQFLLAELGTSGSIDGNNQLIIKGRFQQKQIENVLKRYIKEYVTCHTCRSPNTILQKDARLYFLQCEQCNSRCSVAPIKSGFQAVANKQQRQAIRASKN